MRKLFFLLLFCHTVQHGFAQSGGFNRLYSFSDEHGAHFTDLATNIGGDTLFVCGSAFTDESLPYVSLMVAAIDTFGNLLGQVYHHLPESHMLPFPIVRLKTGGYAVAGTLLHAGFLTKINDSLKIVSNDIYYINNNVGVSSRHLIELSNGGFLMGGHYSKPNYSLYQFVKGIAPSGQEVWSKEYGTPGEYNYMTSFIQLDDSTFVIGGSKSPIYWGQYEWARSHIFAIDNKKGLVKWEWLGPLNEEASIHGLHQTSDKGWIYLTQTYELNPIPDPVETWVAHIKVVRRDSAFNLLWERVLSPVRSYWNKEGDLEATPDGNWVATGWWRLDSTQANGNSVFKACIYKLSDQGDSLWCTCLNPEEAINGPVEPGGIMVLPSGSTVWACRYDQYVPGPGHTYGWLVKVDNDGCVDTLCALPSGVFSPPPQVGERQVNVYPNPATEKVFFDFTVPEKCRGCSIRVSDLSGKVVWSGALGAAQRQVVWAPGDAPAGLYFYSVTLHGQNVASGKILVLR